MSCSGAKASLPWPKGCKTLVALGAPEQHRSDGRLSYSGTDATEDLHEDEAFCARWHLGTTLTRNNLGVSHELSIEPFSWLTPRLLRVGVIP